jgi:hypothetical protein
LAKRTQVCNRLVHYHQGGVFVQFAQVFFHPFFNISP